MALIGNLRHHHKSPMRFIGGPIGSSSIAGASGERGNFNKSGMDRNRITNFPLAAIPNGYTPGYAHTPAQKSGGLGSYTLVTSSGDVTSNLELGLPSSASLSATGNITNADLNLLLNMIANLVGSGELTNAAITALENISANISATGTITNADLTTLVTVFLEASLTAQGTVTDAQLGAVINLTADLSALGQITTANNFATYNMSANISSQTELSPESLAYAVWAATATDNNVAGTMGEKLNDAGSAGNPWSAALVDNQTVGTFGWFIQKLLTTAKFLGFKFF
jgi:hypothetical protein